MSWASWGHPGILCLEMRRWLNLVGLPLDTIFLETCLVEELEALIAWTAAGTSAAASANALALVDTFVEVTSTLH